jgi:predicted small secreted protein
MFARCLAFSIMALISASSTFAQTTKPKWLDAQDFLVRPNGEKNFGKNTPKIGVEFFIDANVGALIAINEAGTIAAAPVSKFTTDRKAAWAFAHELRTRKAEEESWKTSKPYGLEAFQYKAAQQLVYLSDAKGLALSPLPTQVGSDTPPSWQHGLMLKVRSLGQQKFADSKTKIGVEVFKDGNTSGLIYITETGQIATAQSPGSQPDPSAPKRPNPIYGLEPQIRKADEREFTASTRIIPIEVFQDPNSGSLIYLSELGYIATVASPTDIKNAQGLTWSHAMSLKVRKGGEKEFASAAKYGIEVYIDKNTGNVVYLCETGSIAVIPRK